MSYLTANDIIVLKAYIALPISGRWVAEISVSSSDAAKIDNNNAITLQSSDTNFKLEGTAVKQRAGEYLSTVKYRIVAGSNKWDQLTLPRFYQNPRVNNILNNLVGDIEDKLSTTIDNSILITTLPFWTTLQSDFNTSINLLVNRLGPDIDYRYLIDGSVWIGRETWKTNNYEYVLMNYKPEEAIAVLALDSPSFIPGEFIPGIGNINYIEYIQDSETLRAAVWINSDDDAVTTQLSSDE